MYDFQQAMADGKANAKKRIEKLGSSTVRVVETAKQKYAHWTDRDHAWRRHEDAWNEVYAVLSVGNQRALTATIPF